MANQRMYMVCEICMNREELTVEECIQYLTKYYPHYGWFDEMMMEGVRQFFRDHDHRTMDGKYARIIYDSEFQQFAKERDEVTATVGKIISGEG